jgi:hypothetical protein
MLTHIGLVALPAPCCSDASGLPEAAVNYVTSSYARGCNAKLLANSLLDPDVSCLQIENNLARSNKDAWKIYVTPTRAK